jgi:pimeloyl-ACP methyl ester carboxylesterase
MMRWQGIKKATGLSPTAVPTARQALHKAWPRSELHIIRDAGHSAAEAGIIDALVKATNDFALRLA